MSGPEEKPLDVLARGERIAALCREFEALTGYALRVHYEPSLESPRYGKVTGVQVVIPAPPVPPGTADGDLRVG